MSPLFTVVVPSLNHGKYLEQALCSLFTQRADDLEIIVVDGGSTDGSVEIIKKFAGMFGGERFWGSERSSKVLKCESSEVRELGAAENRTNDGRSSEVLKCESSKVCAAELKKGVHDNFRTLELANFRTRFLWCSEPDRGQSHAFNKGFARARGHFLFWLNADDLLLPQTLNCLRAYLNEHSSAEWIAGNQIYIDANGKILRCSRGNHWHDFLYQHAPVHVYGPSSFFSRDLWNRVGGTDETLRYCMDWDLWLKFRKAGARFERLDHYCWALRRHSGSKTQGGERDKEDIHWQEIHAMCKRNGLTVTFAGIWAQRMWRLVTGCYIRGLVDTLIWRKKNKGLI